MKNIFIMIFLILIFAFYCKPQNPCPEGKIEVKNESGKMECKEAPKPATKKKK